MNFTSLKERLKEKGFKPHFVLKICLLLAIVLSFAMALKSDFDRHPDEKFHFAAARYYYNHFLPPVIDDPEILDTYSVFGVSYLNYQWVEYIVAGKIGGALSFFISDEHTAVRFSIIFLFIVITGWFLYRSAKNSEEFILPCFLLISSQVWYVFSYVNNDAFVLFVAMAAAYQLASGQSLLNKFLASENFVEKWAGGLWFGFLAGLILICKPNYYPFLIFAALWVLYKYGLFKKSLVKKYAFMLLIAVSVLTFRCGLDLYVNGETNYVGISYFSKFFGQLEKQGKLLELQEKIALPEFKPSTLRDHPENSNKDLQLMAKGVPLWQMLTDMKWLETSFSSFIGGYGYMNLWPTEKFFRRAGVIFLLFFGYLLFAFIRSRSRESWSQFAITFFCCFLTVAISAALSWIYAFQPQGRYFFPVLPMLGVLVYSNRRLFNNVLMNLLFLILFLFSVYAFMNVALPRINVPI